MKRVIRRLVKGAAAFGLMMIAVVAFASTAFATGSTPGGLIPGNNPGIPEEPATPQIIKRVRVPEGLSIPEHTYTFEFEPGAVQDKMSETSPDINANNKITIAYVSTDPEPTLRDTDGYLYLEKNSGSFLNSAIFDHAGIYSYVVKEIANDPAWPGAGTISYSKAQYRMRVYVDNNTTGNGDDLYVKYVTFHSIMNDAGEQISGETDETKVKPVFTNTYSKDTTFEIEKEVTGSYGDKTMSFNYELTLMAAPGVTSTAVYTAELQDTAGDPISTTQNLSFTVGQLKTFTLKHGEKLVFDEIAAGTKYTLTEKGHAAYQATVTARNGLGDPNPIGTKSGGTGAEVTIGGNDQASELIEKPIVLTDISGSNKNTAKWINEYISITPTGIFMDNLPFILMILIAISGFTGYIVMKRRSRRV